MPQLAPGDTFPALQIDTVAHGRIALPDHLAGQFGVVLFYRGSWCPYCASQLRAFQRSQSRLDEVGAAVVALSVDDEQTSAQFADKLGITFALGHSVDPHAVAEVTGAFVNPDPSHLQSTGFVLAPNGKTLVSVYSSGAIGRLVPEDVVGMIGYVREHASE